MVNISKLGDSAIKFTFTNNDRYLYNGEITVPLNSLILVLDESDMAVLKKIDGDVFLTFLISNSNFSSKSDLEEWFKENACGSTGGGGGVTSGEVETMIEASLENYYDIDDVDAALSAKADTSAVTAVADDVSTVSGQVATKVATSDFNTYSAATDAALNSLDENKQDALVYYSEDTSNKEAHITVEDTDNTITGSTSFFSDGFDIGVTQDVDATTQNSSYINGGNLGVTVGYDLMTGSDETDAHSYFDVNEEGISAEVYANEETTTVNVYTSGVTINGDRVATEPYVDAALSGKVDTSAVTSSVTSASTDTEIPTAKAVYDAIQAGGGGGTTYSAGTNISIANDTINCTLPFIIKSNGIAYNNGYGNIIIGNGEFSGHNSIFTRGSNTGSNMNLDIIIAGGGNKFTGAAQQMLIAGSSNEIKNTSEGYSSAGGNGIIVGQGNKINYSRHNYVFGDYNTGGTSGTTQQEINNYLLIFGEHNKTNNNLESTFGKYNNSVSGSSTFGDSGNTLFSVGNGTSSARHNAFEIRQNGDIYVTLNGQDVKLQDQLGGGGGSSYTAGDGIDITNDVISVTGKVDTSAITTSITSASTNTQVSSAKAVYDQLGGLKLVKLTQAEYDALATKDANTLYIISNVVS